MDSFAKESKRIFNESIQQYHLSDSVDAQMNNPYPLKSIEYYLYLKNWVDSVQWHLEDIIRAPKIDPVKGLEVKRRIDRLNQERTDLVEMIDGYFQDRFSDVKIAADAIINTESPAWAIDRLSILALKIYHMKVEVERNVSDDHSRQCSFKLGILLEQEKDLATAIDTLLDNISRGRIYMKPYKQMKMYNDPTLNPVLYSH